MVVFLTSAIALGIVFLYGCVGEILTEKAGHLNLGIPGVMSVGAAGGCLGISLYMGGLSDTANANYFLVLLSGVLMSALFSAALGAVYSFLTVSLRCNQNVTGLAITTFGVGMTMFLMESVIDRTYFAAASTYITRSLPFADNLGWFGEIFLSHGILVYLGIAVALISGWVLNRTRVGLHLRAVGEIPPRRTPSASMSPAINTSPPASAARLRDRAGSSISWTISKAVGNTASKPWGGGWLAIALVIFTLWRPNLSILGSFVFGGLYIASNYIGGISFSQRQLFALLPYVVTVLVLILTSVLNSRETQPPAALGLAYFREER